MVCPRVLVCLLEDHDTSGHGATLSTTFPPTSRRVLSGSGGQRERYDAKVGRVVFKYLNDDYLLNPKLADADATDL